MLLGGLPDIFIALAMTFGATALLVSSLVEAISSLLKWRAGTLLDGLKSMLNAGTARGWLRFLTPASALLPAPAKVAATAQAANVNLLNDLLNHVALNPRSPGTSPGASVSRGVIASYIPSPQFAIALLDVLRTGPDGVRQMLQTAIGNIPDAQLRQYLTGVFHRAGGDEAKMRAEIAGWFDSAMDRVSGDYKRYTQLWSVLLGFLLAAAFNIDAIKIIHAALINPVLMTNVQATVPGDGLDSLKSLKQAGLAIGWSGSPDQLLAAARAHKARACVKLLGWLMTAMATLFGAPFWFDTLQRFVSLRGTGDPPANAASANQP